MWEFISRLDELLPVPDFTQVPTFVMLQLWLELLFAARLESEVPSGA